MAIHIVTDSSCDLPAATTQAQHVEVVPLTVRIGDREYREGIDITAADFATEMSRSPV